MKTTIETKIAKNGNLIVKVDDGIDSSRKFADAVAALADTTFTGRPDVEIIVDRNDDSHICDIYKGGFNFDRSEYVFTDNKGNEYCFWDSSLALKHFARGIFGEVITVKTAITEANPDDYAITPEAMEIAINAEIEAANATEPFSKAKKLFEDMKEFNLLHAYADKGYTHCMYYPEMNYEFHTMCDVVIKMIDHVVTDELAGHNYSGFKFASDAERCWGSTIQFHVNHDDEDCRYNVLITHDLNSVEFNRRAVEYFINGLLKNSDVQFYFDYIGGNVEDYILPIEIKTEIEAANKEKIAAMQKEVADYIAKIDEQEKQDKVAAFERELIEKGIIKGTAKVANVTNETDGSEDDADEELPDVMPVDDDDTDDELIDEANIANKTDEIDEELTVADISEETLIIMAASLKVIADECYPKDSELWNITMAGSHEAQAELDRRESDEDFTFYDAQIHSYDDNFVSEQFDNPIDAYKWLEMKIKQSYALERGTRQIEFYGKDSYKVIYRYIPDCRELFIDDTLLENFIANKTPKFTYKTKRGKIRTLKIGETNLGTEDNTILNQPKMPPVALKSHANSHDNTNTIDREKTSQIGIEAKIAQLNKNAPDNLQISFDKDKNNFPVKFKGKTITTLDTLALKNFLTPEQFFQQFRPLVDKDYSPKEQFIDDRKKELANLQEMRKSIKDTERLKTIDALIDIIKRDLLEVSLE